MKVGTDGVLLGAWASLPETAPSNGHSLSVLDIGTGTGIIALMLAQRLAKASMPFCVEAIEIDPEAASQASDNFAASPWHTQLCVHSLSLNDFEMTLDPSHRYDLIACNPPFFNATLKPDDALRATARHKDALPPADILRFASHFLTPEGRLALIYPSQLDTEMMTAAVLSGLHPVRICDVVTKVGKPSKRRLTEFSATPDVIPTRHQLAIRNSEGHYTDDYRSLTDAFYLHLSD